MWVNDDFFVKKNFMNNMCPKYPKGQLTKEKKKIILTYHLTTNIAFFFSCKLYVVS